MWVHGRSEESEPTSIECYWKKPRLVQVDKNLQALKAKDLDKSKYKDIKIDSCTDFLNSISKELCSKSYDCQISRHLLQLNLKSQFSIHQILVRFLYSKTCTDVNSFLNMHLKYALKIYV